jgi:hypothetical protein
MFLRFITTHLPFTILNTSHPHSQFQLDGRQSKMEIPRQMLTSTKDFLLYSYSMASQQAREHNLVDHLPQGLMMGAALASWAYSLVVWVPAPLAFMYVSVLIQHGCSPVQSGGAGMKSSTDFEEESPVLSLFGESHFSRLRTWYSRTIHILLASRSRREGEHHQ